VGWLSWLGGGGKIGTTLGGLLNGNAGAGKDEAYKHTVTNIVEESRSTIFKDKARNSEGK